MTDRARDEILNRIRSATGHDTSRYDDLPRSYTTRGAKTMDQCLHLMSERLLDYGAEIDEASPADLAGVLAHRLRLSGRHHFLAPPGLPAAWLDGGIDWAIDHQLGNEEIERCGGVVTCATAGIADSGTIVLHHGPAEGRRVITLLPDFHLCVLLASQVVETLPEYFARFSRVPKLATFISGPSATADIEMTRIQGVHGPRLLRVILVRDDR